LKNLAIYGAGGFGRETALLINQINAKNPTWRLAGFYDDGLAAGTDIDGLSVLGGMDELNAVKVVTGIAIAIADPIIKKGVFERITNRQLTFPSVIHPTFSMGASGNRIGKGCILTAGCILTTGIFLGDFVIINLLSSVGHDVRIGNFSSIMPGCSVSGNVKIGESTSIGTGARILQNLSVGSRCKVGAGAVLTRDFPDDKTIVGVPAEELQK
jgi:sugar O-acyltransferase (sialic acid O-acetyltransferase NeuD family)